MMINFLLVVLILLFTWVGNRYDVKTGHQEGRSVSSIDGGAVKQVEIKTLDTRLQLQRHALGWSIVEPIQWSANQVQVERLINIVNSKTESRLAASELDLAQLGLDLPRAILRLDDTRILFGATNNIGERRYTMIGDEVYLLPDMQLPFMTQGLPGIVDRRLLPAELSPRIISLPDLELRRSPDGGWRADSARLASPEVEQLVANWQALEAIRVRQFDAGVMPRQKIEVSLDDGRKLEFFLISIEPEIILANPQIDLQYHFQSDYYYQLISLRADENSN